MSKVERILAVDWGSQRIGLAIAILEANLVLPLMAISSLKELKKIASVEQIDLLIIGNPLSLSGESNNKSEFNNFLNALKEKISLPIKLFDERLSSKQADVLLGKIDKSKRDSVAAMVILQSYLEKNG